MSSNFNIEIGATQGDDVVFTAWASSEASSASFAVDKIPYFSSFLSGTSNGDQYPWLAIDFYTPASVSGVKIVEAVSDLSFDIEVRVGYEKPFTPRTKGVVYTTNTVSLGLEMQKFSLLLNVQSPLKADMLLFKLPKGTPNCLNMTLI